jgi:hypothetical protein
MLISFSETSMLPFVRAGIRHALGKDVGTERVKRQTIRKLGARAEQLLAHAKDAGNTIVYDLHLYWKSRTPECELLGVIPCSNVRVYPFSFLHSHIEPTDGPEYPCIRIDAPRPVLGGNSCLFWSPGDEPNGFCAQAFNDGFDSPEAFRDYFVPNRGDRFDAILFKW